MARILGGWALVGICCCTNFVYKFSVGISKFETRGNQFPAVESVFERRKFVYFNWNFRMQTFLDWKHHLVRRSFSALETDFSLPPSNVDAPWIWYSQVEPAKLFLTFWKSAFEKGSFTSSFLKAKSFMNSMRVSLLLGGTWWRACRWCWLKRLAGTYRGLCFLQEFTKRTY